VDEPEDIAVLPLTARQVAWLRDQERDFAESLRRILDEQIRQAILKRAHRDEARIENMIRRRLALIEDAEKARVLEQRRREGRKKSRDSIALSGAWGELYRRAQRETVEACSRMSDAVTREAARRYAIARCLMPGTCAELQRLRENRHGGWK
jgi:hypothetical protein